MCLARYIGEFTFRWNEGNSKLHALERLDGLIHGAIGKRITYAELIR